MKTLGQRVRERRLLLGYTQGELAEKVGLKSNTSINKIESDLQSIRSDKMKAFADALEVTPEWLMWGENGVEVQTTSLPRKVADVPKETIETIVVQILSECSKDEKDELAGLLSSYMKAPKANRLAVKSILDAYNKNGEV